LCGQLHLHKVLILTTLLMAVFDIVVVILLVVGAIRGLRQGFLSQLASVVALLLGIWGAVRFSDYMATLLSEKFDIGSAHLPIISFAVTFILIVIAIHFIEKIVERFLNLAMLGGINKVLGFVFGFAKYAIITSVLLVFVEKANIRFNFFTEEQKSKSLVYNPVASLAPAIFPYLHFDTIKESVKKSLGNQKGK